jgi:hypothetical protein
MREGIIFCLCFSLAYQPWLAHLAHGQSSHLVTDANTGGLVDVVTTYAYDDSDAPGSPSSVTGPLGLTRYFDYDKNGRQTRAWHYWEDANDSGNNCIVSTLTKYDSAGRAIETRRVISDVNGSVADSNVLLSRT